MRRAMLRPELPFDPMWLTPFGLVGASLKDIVRWTSQHTGLPVVLIAAVAMVIAWRVFKRSVRFLVEVAIALTVVFVATKLGWMAW
jgi:hypothetical protein